MIDQLTVGIRSRYGLLALLNLGHQRRVTDLSSFDLSYCSEMDIDLISENFLLPVWMFQLCRVKLQTMPVTTFSHSTCKNSGRSPQDTYILAECRISILPSIDAELTRDV